MVLIIYWIYRLFIGFIHYLLDLSIIYWIYRLFIGFIQHLLDLLMIHYSFIHFTANLFIDLFPPKPVPSTGSHQQEVSLLEGKHCSLPEHCQHMFCSTLPSILFKFSFHSNDQHWKVFKML